MSIHTTKREARGSTASAVRQMRMKTIRVAMLAVSVILALIIGVVDLISWNNTCTRLDSVLDYLEITDGDLGQLDYDPDAHPGMSTQAFEALQEMPYDARYFSVTLDQDEEPADFDMTSIASVSKDSASDMAADVVKSRKDAGFEGNYRFRVATVEDDDGNQVKKIYFLYSYSQLESFRAFRRATTTMGIVGLLAFAAVVVPFSRTATRPVEEAQERQRRFVTDASHELRTPISIIQSATDVIEIENGETDWTRSIHNQTKRLEDLTNKLVALVKADEGSQSLTLSDVDVSRMALQIAEDFETVSQSQGKQLTCDIGEGLHCRADAGMLEQAISILLDNAFKHSSEGAHVRFTVSQAGEPNEGGNSDAQVKIATVNEADGVAAGEHPEFFRRFYKADASRSHEGTDVGHGIGLAVVRAIAEAHGGSFAAVSDGRDVTVSITL